MRAGGLLWLLCCQFFVAEQVAMLGWTKPYSMARNYISDLGAVHCVDAVSGFAGASASVCSPWHALMNSSFFVQGYLIAGGAWLLYRSLARGRLAKIALLLFIAAGLGVLIVGLAPEDVYPRLHATAASLHFLCGNAVMVLIGPALLRQSSSGAGPLSRHGSVSRNTGWVSVCAGAVGLLALGLLAGHRFLGMGVGGMERLVAYPFPAWLTAAGVWVLWQMRAGESIADPG